MEICGMTLGESLGSGGFGSVFAARARRDVSWCKKGTIVAVKKFANLSQLGEKGTKTAARKEFDLMRNASCSFVIKALRFVCHGANAYILMEKGEASLERMIAERESMLIPEVKSISKCILRGLEHLHKFNIVHRDLKPGNIILVIGADATFHPKLADFGMAARLRRGEVSTDFPGSPFYMAPEIAMELPHGTAVDIYCFGVTMMEMLVLPASTENASD